MSDLTNALQQAICSTMEDIACVIPYTYTSLLNTLHSLGSLSEVLYQDDGAYVIIIQHECITYMYIILYIC